MCLIHKWSNWKQIEVMQAARQITKRWALCAAIEYLQQKTCIKCGKIKTEYLYSKCLDA